MPRCKSLQNLMLCDKLEGLQAPRWQQVAASIVLAVFKPMARQVGCSAFLAGSLGFRV